MSDHIEHEHRRLHVTNNGAIVTFTEDIDGNPLGVEQLEPAPGIHVVLEPIHDVDDPRLHGGKT